MSVLGKITTIDTHTGGNPTRTVIHGAPKLVGHTMLEKMTYMAEHHDDFRRLLMFEPRGHEVMSGCILTEPCHPGADIGVVFVETGGYLPMCGHDTIGVCTALVEGGLIAADKKKILLDTPAGPVQVLLDVAEGKVRQVTFTNIPSFVYRREVEVDVEGIGQVTLDIAYGGNFYGMIEAASIGLGLEQSNGAEIVRTAVRIREAVNAVVEVVHPENPVIRGLTHIEFYGEPVALQADCRNVVVIPPGGIDRSPCGTGTSAKVAVLHAKGKLGLHESFVHESITGSMFRAEIVGETQVGSYPAVIPQITGSAWVTGHHQFVLDPEDPLREGFLLM
ncbi:proline racemase [Paenibacillus sp. IHB B 3084]|uniref:proline racemase family protein n=1 Tax=Paenibacillus TaxID=44249 RepID=UPI000721A821|nr:MULTISPECIES: proline racemase family protein [Paenibacillus]ALP35903.1 proline racemase [Paenibacillus sp. IHB B 3084]